MANEKRLIDANAYPCQTCEVSYCYKNCEKFNAWFNKTVDAVEVVRCKDCSHYVKISNLDKDCRCNIFCGCYERPYPTEPNDFCSYGERRTEDDQNRTE